MRRVAVLVLLAIAPGGARARAVDLSAATGPCAAIAPALARAADWLAAFPPAELRFDAAVMLSETRRRVDGDALRRAFAAARAVADHDDDNPQRRFWVEDLAAPPEHTSRWMVPVTPGVRVNTNRVVEEALFCAEHGWRPETMAYVCGSMRDGGGYHSTHALWALDLARRRGCVTKAAFHACARPIAAELAVAQPERLAPARSLDVDLWAERLLVLARAGWPVRRLDPWARALLARQDADGSWTVARPEEPPYHGYHATAMATWALAEWCRRS
jgi:hypothetical protein